MLLQVQIRPGLVHKDEDGELEKVDKVRLLSSTRLNFTTQSRICADGAVQTSPSQQCIGSELMAGDGTAMCIALA